MLHVASAAALPEGRHYEMVSPPYKGGYGVLLVEGTATVGSEEGEAVVFDSAGHFEGQPVGAITGLYLARRDATGWSSSPLLPPQLVSPASAISDISPTLQGLYNGASGPNYLAAEYEGGYNFFWHDLLAPDDAAHFLTPFTEPGVGVPLHRRDGLAFTLTGSISSDPGFCHVVFSGNSLNPARGEALLPEAENAYLQMYELVTGAPGCGGEPALRLIAVTNKVKPDGEHELIEPNCVSLVSQGLNAVAAGGSEIFFTPCVSSPAAQLYVRLDGARTVKISTPIAADCASGPCLSSTEQLAEFVGANEAGTRVFFMTKQPLVTGDTDTASDLYMAEIGCPAAEPGCEPAEREVTSVVQISHDANGAEAARVQGVAMLAMDGERVYFVASGVLSGANGEGAAPVAGADNLYVYDLKESPASETATTHFVADLCSGSQLSGEASDRRCPNGGQSDSGIWAPASKETQTTQDGSFLLFTSFGRLVAGDTDSGRDVYRYDAQREKLDRVSVGEEGYDRNGNGEGFNAQLPFRGFGQVRQNYELGFRAISEDGSRVVFETAEPLSPSASNGLTNAYEWHKEVGWGEGRVGLVSSGSDEAPVGQKLGGDGVAGEIMITPSGRDIFFLTPQGLLRQDTDGVEDVYDVRLGPGFPPEAGRPKECEGDACQGALSNPAPLLVPGSVSQAPGENIAPAKAKPKKKPKKKPKAKKRRKAKRAGRHGRTANRGRRRR